MVAFTMLFAACSKEAKLNKKLDGEWEVTSYNGAALSGESIVLAFEKDKKEGTYTQTYTVGSVSTKVTGTYTLTGDETITLTPSTSGAEVEVLTVTSYSKTEMTVKNSDGYVIILKKK